MCHPIHKCVLCIKFEYDVVGVVTCLSQFVKIIDKDMRLNIVHNLIVVAVYRVVMLNCPLNS